MTRQCRASITSMAARWRPSQLSMATTEPGPASSPPTDSPVVLVEFRNSVGENALDEVAPYPAGLNDCRRWLASGRSTMQLAVWDRSVARRGGGAKVAAATWRSRRRFSPEALRRSWKSHQKVSTHSAHISMVSGLMIDTPSSVANNGIFINVHGQLGPRELRDRSAGECDLPLAWPGICNGGGCHQLVFRQPSSASMNAIRSTTKAWRFIDSCCRRASPQGVEMFWAR